MARLMDWTVKDNMARGLFFCATFTSLDTEGAYRIKQERRRATPVRRRRSWTHAAPGRAIQEGWVPMSGKKVRSLAVLSNHPAFHWWSTQIAALLLLSSDEVMSCCAACTNRCLDLGCRAFPTGERVRAEWSRSPGHAARCVRDNVAPLKRSSTGWMPARIGRLSAGLGRNHPVTIRKASLMSGSVKWAWALRHQAGAQDSAVEWARAKVAVRNVAAAAPPARARVRRVMSVFCEATRGVSVTWASYPTLLRGIWARSRKAGFRRWSWLSGHV